jgi:hypothetical protein
MTKSSQRADATRSTPLNGGKQEVESLDHDTAAPVADGNLPSDIRSRIEVLAYDFYLRRGCRHGEDVQDWLEAERLTLGATK